MGEPEVIRRMSANLVATPEYSSSVKFHPFIGERYESASDWGVRLLILGESHYHENGTYPQYTQDVVAEYCNNDYNLRFFTNVFKAFHGTVPKPEQRPQFWSGVAYYVFAQELVEGNKPRARPSDDNWEVSLPAFEEVCAKLKPQLILVLGKDTWQHLPSGVGEVLVELPNGQTCQSCMYEYGGSKMLAFRIEHPMAFGWSAPDWTPWIKAAMSTAIAFHAEQGASSSR